MPEWQAVLAELQRERWGSLLAALLAWSRRLDLAEDALADAYAAAARSWRDGVPDRPESWLLTTARRRLTDRIRAEAMARRKLPLLAVAEEERYAVAEPDQLRLVLLCCHPALAAESQAALALRLVLGVPTEEIARLFLVRHAAMSARLTRAKKKIVASGIPFGLPPAERLGERIAGALRASHLAFTAGYAPSGGPDLLRAELAGDAIRLTRVIGTLARSDAAVGLLALQLFQHARRDARFRDGRLVLLAEQDRGRWHGDEIAEAAGLVAGLRPAAGWAEELRLQALIAAEHATADHAEKTDWVRIAALYAALESMTGSPIVRMNRAVAVAEVAGPQAGLALLDGLEAALGENVRLPVVRAELSRRAGRPADARAYYLAALDRGGNEPERAQVRERLASLD